MLTKIRKIKTILVPYVILISWLGITLPIQIYKNNYSQLNFSLMDVTAPMLLWWLSAVVLGAFFIHILQKKVDHKTLIALVSAIGFLLFVQATFLRWNYGPIEDGNWYKKWEYGVYDTLIWLAVIGLSLRFKSKVSPVASKASPWVAAYVIILAIISFLQTPLKAVPYKLDEKPKFHFSSTKNVIFILLDETQSNIFFDLAQADKNFKDFFKDFNFFPDAMSNTSATSLSVPMILTGRYYDNSITFESFVKEGLKNHSILRLFKDLGYHVDFYPIANFYFVDRYIDPSFVSNITSRHLDPHYMRQLYNLALFSAVPHFAKIKFPADQWHLKQRSEKRGHAQILDTDISFVERASTDLRIDDSTPRFKFYHLVGSHAPFNIDETGERIDENSEGAYYAKMKYKIHLLSRFLRMLKETPIYNNSLIVLLSDHGSGRTRDTRTFKNNLTGQPYELSYDQTRANALLMIKDFGSAGTAKTLNTPLQLTDLKLLMQEMLSGKTLLQALQALPPAPVRRFFSYNWRFDRPYAREYEEYIVKGPIWQPGSFVND